MAQWMPRCGSRPFNIPTCAANRAAKCAAKCASVFAFASIAACGKGKFAEQTGTGRIADVASSVSASNVDAQGAPSLGAKSAAVAVPSLARAAGGTDGAHYTVRSGSTSATIGDGIIVGRIGGGERASRDTIVVPTHNMAACEPFTQRAVPSAEDGVGNAVVWLVGVASGPSDAASRRAPLRLAGCRLEPRVQRVPVGGTMMITSRDAMMSRLRFVDVGGDGAARATVLFNDVGQVVPTSAATARAGLIEVRDDLHPWVRAYIAVAPHPFVAVTVADGKFRFDGVPTGRYTLVVWSEVLGTRTRELVVTSGVETRIDITY